MGKISNLKHLLQGSNALAWSTPLSPLDPELIIKIQAEIRRIPSELFVPQVNSKNVGWSQFLLRGIDPKMVGHFTRYGYESADDVPWRWMQEHIQLTPLCHQLIQESFSFLEMHRVAIHRLAPKGVIHEHIDDLQDISAAFLVALDWPRGCALRVDNRLVEVKSGDVFHINYMRRHSVKNLSLDDRFALSIMGKPKSMESFLKSFLLPEQEMATPSFDP